MALPPFLKQYFWEIRFENLDPAKRATYIIERLLEYGDVPSLRWMLKKYPKEQIIEVLKRTRVVSRKSANFWALYFSVPREEILCFQKRFLETSGAIWNY